MKIGIIQPRISYYQGGGEKTQIKYAKYLALAGHQVILYTLCAPKGLNSFYYKSLLELNLRNLIIREFEIPEKFRYIFLQQPGEDRNRWDSESLLFNQLIFNSLQKDSPDVVISCYILDGVFRPINIPGVLYLAGYPSDELEIRKSFLRFFDATVSISNNVMNKWEVYLKEVKRNHVVNKGVELDENTSMICSGYTKNIVFAGRLVERKGLATLIKAMGLLIKKFPDLHLWILGDGPQKDKINLLIRQERLKRNVSLTGQVNNVNDYFRMASLCVFPSYEKEGLMGVVLEAMSVGKPVITTTNNGNEDVIENGKTGILVEPKNTNQLMFAIKDILDKPKKGEAIGKKAQKYVRRNLTWKKETDKLIKILAGCVK